MNRHIMRPKLFIAATGLSLVLALPVSQALSNRDKTIQSQKKINHDLRLQLDKLKSKRIIKKGVVQSRQAVKKLPVSISTHKNPQVKLASYSCENYSSIFEQYNWNVNTAMAICQAESRGNPNAISNSSINYDGLPDYGLMQLHNVDILNPGQNIAFAYYHKYLTQGWSAWSTYNSGAYLNYL